MQDHSPDLSTWTPFHVSNWPAPIANVADYDGGERLRLSWDLGALDEKDKKRAIKDWCIKLPQLQHVRWLNLWTHVTPPVFEALCQMRNLECLQIKWSNIRQLDAIAGLKQLRYLHIGSSTKVESLQPLTGLTGLKLLEIENFKLIADFSPLLSLTGLEVLSVTGSMWTRQNVASLEPFGRMTWLRALSVDTSKAESLRPLANLKNLQGLGIGGNAPMQEYAWLAAHLPATDCRWFHPYYDLARTGYSHCPKCKNDSMVMLTGKGAKILCRLCDQAKVEAHVAAYQAARESAGAGQALHLDPP